MVGLRRVESIPRSLVSDRRASQFGLSVVVQMGAFTMSHAQNCKCDGQDVQLNTMLQTRLLRSCLAFYADILKVMQSATIGASMTICWATIDSVFVFNSMSISTTVATFRFSFAQRGVSFHLSICAAFCVD